MVYGSVCSGIESASIAWEPLGMLPSWFAEVEAFPSAVLAHHWPHVANFGDMCNLPYLISAGLAPAPDVLVGGTPCQAFSLGGRREGMDDERGKLTLKFVEIANEIDKQRSGEECVVVWENVPGVLSSRGNAFGCFLGGLAGEDCELKPSGDKWTNAGIVYGPKRTVAWRVLDAQYFGVAQRRRRVFVIASGRRGFDPGAVLFEHETPADDLKRVLSKARGYPVLTCRTAGNSNARGVVIFDGRHYRALTPEEEEVRQGFQRGHTKISYNGLNAEDCPDGPRYKAIGNSKAVPVIRFVGERIIKELFK